MVPSTWFAREGVRQALFGLVLWLLLVPVLLASSLRPGLVAEWIRIAVLAAFLVLATAFYLRRYPNRYQHLLLLGLGWSALGSALHVLVSRYYWGRSWESVWVDSWSGGRIGPALALILAGPFLVGLLWTGTQGVIAFLIWLRSTRRGMFTLLVIWLVGTLSLGHYLSGTPLSWVGHLTLEVKVTWRLSDLSTRFALLPALAVVLALFVVTLLPPSPGPSGASTYVGRLKKTVGHLLALPLGITGGLALDWVLIHWLEALMKSLTLDGTLALGETLGHFSGSYGTLLGIVIAVGYWTWRPLK